jgi:GDP-mannose 6-dehydrogenase
VPIAVAEMTKYVDNSFHALKVAFANEIGAVCQAANLDSHAVMDIFLSDEKLNISRAYLRPGMAFGGSCLPKDVRALTHTARRHDVDLPVLSNVLVSNEMQVRRTVEMITGHDRRRVAVLGLSFKAGTDDLRESPLVEIVERLVGKGYSVRIWDPNVSLARLVGANREQLAARLPHISELLTDDLDEVLEHGDVVVVGTGDVRVTEAVESLPAEKVLVDLVRLPDAAARRGQASYAGIAW